MGQIFCVKNNTSWRRGGVNKSGCFFRSHNMPSSFFPPFIQLDLRGGLRDTCFACKAKFIVKIHASIFISHNWMFYQCNDTFQATGLWFNYAWAHTWKVSELMIKMFRKYKYCLDNSWFAGLNLQKCPHVQRGFTVKTNLKSKRQSKQKKSWTRYLVSTRAPFRASLHTASPYPASPYEARPWLPPTPYKVRSC